MAPAGVMQQGRDGAGDASRLPPSVPPAHSSLSILLRACGAAVIRHAVNDLGHQGAVGSHEPAL